jgi:hypothetical protein
MHTYGLKSVLLMILLLSRGNPYTWYRFWDYTLMIYYSFHVYKFVYSEKFICNLK